MFGEKSKVVLLKIPLEKTSFTKGRQQFLSDYKERVILIPISRDQDFCLETNQC